MVLHAGRRTTAAVVAVLASLLGQAVAAPTATALEPDWWFDHLRLPEVHQQVQGDGATIALIDDSMDPLVPALKGQRIHKKVDCTGAAADMYRLEEVSEHGTGMASLLVGGGRNGGITGVAPQADLFFYATMQYPPNNADCSQMAVGRLWGHARKHDVDVINMSQTLGRTASGRKYLRQLLRSGAAPLVASLGPASEARTSDFTPEQLFFPATFDGVVAVNAVGPDGKPKQDTFRSRHTVVAAPGVDIGVGRLVNGAWDDDGLASGTSSATAIVAGSLALVKSAYPTATGNQLIQHLVHNTSRAEYGWDPITGFGVVDPVKMLSSDPTQWPDENPLLKGPRAAVRAYPMWASSEIDAPPGATDRWAQEEAAASADADVDDVAADDAPTPSDATGGGVPWWAWLGGLLAALLALGLGGTVVRARKRS